MYKTEHYICCDWCGNRHLLEYKYQYAKEIYGWGLLPDGSHACPACVKKLREKKEVRFDLNDDDVSELKKMLEREVGECTMYSEDEREV